MGKKGVSSWFTAVKRAFRPSSTKESEKNSSKSREENEKRREKRRWIFRKPAANHETKMATNTMTPPGHHILDAEQRHAVAVAAAMAAAAEAATATAQAAAEIIRLTSPTCFVRGEYAAVVIQTTFRGYLARRALRALKGIVKLQALVRGHNVRRKVTMMMECMHAQARAQTQVGDRRSKLSHEGNRNYMFAESNELWESRYLQNIRDRKTIFTRDGSCIADEWDDCQHRLEGIKGILRNRKEAALKREKSLAYAFSHKISRTGRNRNKSVGNESELDGGTKWLDRWMATKQWESSRVSARRYSYSAPNYVRRQQHQSHQQPASPHSVAASPRNRARNHSSLHSSPRTPPLSKIRQLSVCSVSPRCLKEERSYSATHTPNLGSYRFTGGMCGASASVGAATAPMPNYMAATKSAKARVTRPSTPETERFGSARKRLSYPVPEPHNSTSIGRSSVSQNVRSPSFKNVEDISGMEQQQLSNLYSPCSTTYLKRWLR